MSQKLKFPLVAEQIIRKIESGEYPLNSELPTLDELTKLYQVSRMTAQRALKILSSKGYVSARRGNKTRIISPKPLEKLSILRGKHIGMLANYAVMDANHSLGGSGQMQLLYYLQRKLTDLGNHVMGFQYVDDLDLRADDFDCYIMFDPLGIRHHLHPLLEKTGKPYAVIEIMGSEGCRHNHVHLLFTFVQMRLLSHFLKNNVSHIVVTGLDPRSVSRNMSEEEFNRVDEVAQDRLAGWFKRSLANNGFPLENFIVINCGLQEEQTAKMVEGLLQRNKIRKKTAFIAACENNAVGISKALKQYEWKSKDFFLTVFDPIAKFNHALPGVIGTDISLDEVLAQVVEAFEYQFSRSTNYVPGSVVRTVFQRYCHI